MAVLKPSSRLIVKNLPEGVSEGRVRRAFAAAGGELTDVSLKFKDGRFRGFAFVGFKTEEQATAAKRHLDGNFMGALKIRVEYCADRGDAAKPRAWSKHAKDSSAYKKAHEEEEEEEEEDEGKAKKKSKKARKAAADKVLEKYKDDPKFQEFLRVHKRNAASWSDDSVLQVAKSYNEQSEKTDEEVEEEVAEEKDEEEKEGEANVAKDSAVSDLDYLKKLKKQSTAEKNKKEPKNETYHTVKLSGLPFKAKKKDVKEFFKPLKAKSIRVPVKIKGIAYAGFAEEADLKKALNKNKSFLKGHQVTVRPYVDGQKQKEGREGKWEAQEASLAAEETVAESGRIFVRNLCYSVTEDDLEALFKEFGPLSELTLPVDRLTRRVKGFAMVTFMMPEHAVRAYAELDGTNFQGRSLHLLPGKAKPNEEEDGAAEGMSFKKKKALKEKAAAASSHNWNTLFLGSSAVAEVMAQSYNVAKSDVLLQSEADGGKRGQSAAVKLALGETQLVAETKKFLEAHGVCLEAFDGQPSSAAAAARSKTVILVRNLPAGVAAEKIRDTFAPHGQLGRVILPPGLVTALVEFLEPSEAKKAFRALAYTKFQNTPLYLEWAPEKSLSPMQPQDVKQDVVADANDEDDEDATPEENSTLFVKNLNFATEEDALRAHFSSAGRVHSATVSRKKSPGGELLSMGYGFVQFRARAAAERALKTLQHRPLDGHCLELKRSSRAAVDPSRDAASMQKRKATNAARKELESAKIMVRNVPFQADAEEVRQIFETFGSLKSVRLPKKLASDGGHRGFAFVEFATKSDACRAMDALRHSTHLYGRRLVLEWAEQEETLESMQRKTAGKMAGSSSSSGEPRVKRAKVMEDVLLRAGKE